MRMTALGVVAAGVLICVGAASAADLVRVDRTIMKEPAYQAKPKYCLLVFGPEAKHRVWLVMDGDTLYVDKNGNGDLTEAASASRRRTSMPVPILPMNATGRLKSAISRSAALRTRA